MLEYSGYGTQKCGDFMEVVMFSCEYRGRYNDT
jgi:hypothetical protein